MFFVVLVNNLRKMMSSMGVVKMFLGSFKVF